MYDIRTLGVRPYQLPHRNSNEASDDKLENMFGFQLLCGRHTEVVLLSTVFELRAHLEPLQIPILQPLQVS